MLGAAHVSFNGVTKCRVRGNLSYGETQIRIPSHIHSNRGALVLE